MFMFYRLTVICCCTCSHILDRWLLYVELWMAGSFMSNLPDIDRVGENLIKHSSCKWTTAFFSTHFWIYTIFVQIFFRGGHIPTLSTTVYILNVFASVVFIIVCDPWGHSEGINPPIHIPLLLGCCYFIPYSLLVTSLSNWRKESRNV